MVRKVIHTNKILYSLAIAVLAIPLILIAPPVGAANTCSSINGAGNSCLNDITFKVNIKEVLQVSVTAGTTSRDGMAGDFIRNKVSLDVTSNNVNGFVAYMTSNSTNTSLSNGTDTIATLASSVTPGESGANFTANSWGYSITDADTLNTSATYLGIPASNGTPATILSKTSASTGSQNIYFAAKADSTKSSGTYTGTVTFTVVSGVSTPGNVPDGAKNNPATPNNATTGGNAVASYNANNYSGGSTVYTKITEGTDAISGTTNKKLSYIYSGNTLSATSPLGVTTSVGEGTPLAIGLAVTAAVAATAGIIFFIVAKRKKEDDEEDEDW